MASLGLYYEEGIGTQKDAKKAEYWHMTGEGVVMF
jgi:TPR repeat protein